ncbi:PEBP-like protein [Mycena amicta]|nr:PEBP-like protein [Mycena amicta]
MIFSPLTGTLTLFGLVALVAAQDISTREVKAAFDAANIPADIEIVFNPTALLEVALPQTTGAPIRLHAGINVERNDTAIQPIFHLIPNPGVNVGPGPFVVATVDPDAPTPQDPTEAQVRHFLAGNFFLHEGLGLLKNNTPAVSNWRQPTPPAGSDAHRYIFLVFHQSPAFAHQQLVNATTSVDNFNISAFAAAVGLGNPIAGTFMKVAPDPA